MNAPDPSGSFVILGMTVEGRTFRPSDWAERLCGVMSSYRPGFARQSHLGYSPYVIPDVRDGVKCVKVDARLYALEPLAYRFLVGFANDNKLRTEPLPAAAPPAPDRASHRAATVSATEGLERKS